MREEERKREKASECLMQCALIASLRTSQRQFALFSHGAGSGWERTGLIGGF